MTIKNVQNLYKLIISEFSEKNSCSTPSKLNNKDNLAKNTELVITTEKHQM